MKNSESIITSDDILGKDVLDKSGDIIGVVQMIHIDKKSKQIIGITIDEGFLRPDLYIGINYIKKFGVDAIFLSIEPAQKFVGLKVFDSNGKERGKVTKVELARSKVKSLKIKSGLKTIEISASKIKKIESSVLLK